MYDANFFLRGLKKQVEHEGEPVNSRLLRHLMCLPSPCFVLMLWQNQESGVV